MNQGVSGRSGPRAPRWATWRGLTASRAGWGTAILIAPHLLLGAWLAVVPDYVACRTNQVVVLLHVAASLITLPIVAAFVLKHTLKMNRRVQTRQASGESWLLLATVAGAVATGGLVMWGGPITP